MSREEMAQRLLTPDYHYLVERYLLFGGTRATPSATISGVRSNIRAFIDEYGNVHPGCLAPGTESWTRARRQFRLARVERCEAGSPAVCSNGGNDPKMFGELWQRQP
jgi:hypothetical protein